MPGWPGRYEERIGGRGTMGAMSAQPSALGGAADESLLLSRMRAGEERAFEELVRAMSARMLAVARRMMRSEEDARDAVQDAWASAFRGLAAFDGQSRLSTWLHRITVNACLMRLRTKRRKPERSIEELLPRFKEDGHQWEPSAPWREIGGAAMSGETAEVVRKCIDELPEAYRTVLVLRDLEGVDTAEAAEMLGLSENALKTRLHRARQALRELLDPYMRKGVV